MKEIGEAFKEARETIGISKSEVVKDLNITESQLDNLEDGNFNAFRDVFFLKDTIKGELFTPRNMKYLRNISICCVIIAIITLVAGKFYLPFFIVGGTFAFLGLLTYSLRGIFISQTENAAAQNNGK